MFNKRQRYGLLVLLFVIVLIQTIIYFSSRLTSNSPISTSDSIVSALNLMEIKNKQLQIKEIKYFKFDPNKLEYSYWKYFKLDEEQLYLLDSFRSKHSFKNYEEVRKVLRFSSEQDSIFEGLIYFPAIYNKKKKKYKHSQLFEFNPNIITVKEWEKLGFSKKQSEVIVKYIERNKPIKSKSELGKIYVIDEKKINELWDYILLPDYVKEEYIERDLNKCIVEDLAKFKVLNTNDINLIINYKKKLGGFYKSTQLYEIKGIAKFKVDSMLKKIYIDKDFRVKRININNCKLVELENHPYISEKFAAKIFDFRVNFREYKSLEELKKIETLSDTYFNKIALYLSAD